MGASSVFKLGLVKRDEIVQITPKLIEEIKAAEGAGSGWLRHNIPDDISFTLNQDGRLTGQRTTDLGKGRLIEYPSPAWKK